jgi:hypothetical protein
LAARSAWLGDHVLLENAFGEEVGEVGLMGLQDGFGVMEGSLEVIGVEADQRLAGADILNRRRAVRSE